MRGLNNTLTLRGLMQILKQLAERKVVSMKASEEMIAILRGQKFAEGIPAGLPAGATVAHKTGSFGQVYHDAAIVEPARGKPLVLVVLTRGIKEPPRAHKLVADITRAVYQHAETARRCRVFLCRLPARGASGDSEFRILDSRFRIDSSSGIRNLKSGSLLGCGRRPR